MCAYLDCAYVCVRVMVVSCGMLFVNGPTAKLCEEFDAVLRLDIRKPQPVESTS
jgi:hypothetical protein